MFRMFQALRDNEHLISARSYGKFTIIEMNRDKVIFQGRRLSDHGRFGRRKWENLFIINQPNLRLKFQYTT